MEEISFLSIRCIFYNKTPMRYFLHSDFWWAKRCIIDEECRIFMNNKTEATKNIVPWFYHVPYFFFFISILFLVLNEERLKWILQRTIKVQVHNQIFFAKDCMPCNRLCRNCSCYWSIFLSVSVLEYRFTVIIPQKSVNKDCKACEMWHRNFACGNAA